MRGRILMLLLFAANAHNFLRVLGAMDEDKVTKHINRIEMDQYMHVLELKSMIYKILHGNDKITERLEKGEGMLELVKMQVRENAHLIKLPECERWLQKRNLERSNFIRAEGKHFYYNDTTKVTWSEARDWCAKMGMQMAILKSISQMDAVAKELKERDADGLYWMGASDVGQTPGEFHWADGTLVDGNTWRNGTIYKYHGDLFETTCVKFQPGITGLIDVKCSWRYLILCEAPSCPLLAACL